MAIFGNLYFGKHFHSASSYFIHFLFGLKKKKPQVCIVLVSLKNGIESWGEKKGKKRKEEGLAGMRGKERERQAVFFHAFCHQPCLELPCWASWKVRPFGQGFRGISPSPLPLYFPEGEALWHHMFL